VSNQLVTEDAMWIGTPQLAATLGTHMNIGLLNCSKQVVCIAERK